MSEHNIFYFPYATFTDQQVPLLKASALYFDTLYILDPFQATWDIIGSGDVASDIKMLRDEGILKSIDPKDVFYKYEKQITDAIRADLQNKEFLDTCDSFGKHQQWTLALAKVPKAIRNDPEFRPIDRSMQHLMGDFAKEMAQKLDQQKEGVTEYTEYSEHGTFYDEYREGEFGDEIEYRYADYPLALGEAIMLNHALFAGMSYSSATPLTDDPFHNRILDLKIRRAYKIPEIRDILEDRYRQLQIKQDQYSQYLLTDRKIDLPFLSPKLSLEDLLEHRHDRKDELQQARQKLSQLSRKIKEIPLTKDFTQEVDAALADVDGEIQNLKKARDSWLKSDKGKRALQASGLVLGAAATIITLVTGANPLLSIPMITGALGFAGGSVIPGLEFIQDLKKGKKDLTENGLHYFIDFDQSKK